MSFPGLGGAVMRPWDGIKHFMAAIRWGDAGVIACFALTALVGGASIPVFGMLIPIMLAALAVCAVILSLSPINVIWFMLVLVLLIVGQLTFFFGISKAFWLPYLLLLLMAVKFLMEKIGRVVTPEYAIKPGPVTILLWAFFAVFLFSAIVNGGSPSVVGVAAKNYVFPWFLTAFVASTITDPVKLRSVWRFMLWVACIQVLFAIPQHFYYAKQVGASWDAVVGSFGGAALRGGASGTMAIFLVFAIVLAAALFRRQQLSRKWLVSVVVLALATVALAEVKIFIVTLPLGLVLLFRSAILVNLGRSILYGMVGLMLLGSVLFTYQQAYSERLNSVSTVQGFVDYIFVAESDPYFFNPQTRELSRLGAILMWSRHNGLTSIRRYFGHGPAASRESQTLGDGVLVRKYPFTLSTSAASSMLWDVGMTGFGLYLSILLAGAMSAIKSARVASPYEAAALESTGVMFLLSIPLSFYNRDVIDSATTQTLLAFWLGYTILCRRAYGGLSARLKLNRQFPWNAQKEPL